MTDLVFVDTNVLVYARDRSDETKRARAQAWMDRLWKERRGRLSVQVLQEYYVTVTRKIPQPMDASIARDEIRDLATWEPITIGPELLDIAFGLEDRFQLSFWDALIVAAANIGRCRWLLTEDLQDGQKFEGVTVLNPFGEHGAPGGLTG